MGGTPQDPGTTQCHRHVLEMATNRRIEYGVVCSMTQSLLAQGHARVGACGWVKYTDQQLILCCCIVRQRVCDVKLEGIIAPTVPAHELAIDPDSRIEVDSTKMQQDAVFVWIAWKAKMPPVPHFLHMPTNLTQGRLHRKGHHNPLFP